VPRWEAPFPVLLLSPVLWIALTRARVHPNLSLKLYGELDRRRAERHEIHSTYSVNFSPQTHIRTMFRDADRQDRSLHESYTNSGWGRRHEAPHNQPIPAVPTTYDTRYDPNHPDADWTGQVSRSTAQRKHCTDHSSQRLGIEQSEYGIIAKVEKKEWANRRQHHLGEAKNGSQILLGGVSGVGGDADRFKTEYRRFAEQEGTEKSQMVLQKRLTSVKRIVDPVQARSMADRHYGMEAGGYNNSLNSVSSNAPFATSTQNQPPQYASTSASFASTPASPYIRQANKSMLSDIGSQIASRINAPTPSSTYNGASAMEYSKNRVMVAENFRAYPTGYTGGRKGV
jgi:hypothetical protein